jgi:molybdopterin synthase sulfur carrier subunit
MLSEAKNPHLADGTTLLGDGFFASLSMTYHHRVPLNTEILRSIFIMANVRLAPVLRASAGGAKQVSAQGSTLSEVLADLYSRYPALKEQIQPEETLSRFINVYINDQDVRYLQGIDSAVGPNDTVILLPAMAGGR